MRDREADSSTISAVSEREQMLLHRSGKNGCPGSSWLALAWFLLLSLSSAWSQQFTFSDYGVGSGLSNLNAMNLLEDRTGLVWAGTQSGIFTADGANFVKQKAFTDAGLEYIRALREDHAGRLWAVDGQHLVYWQDGAVHMVSEVHLAVLSHEVLDLVIPSDGSDSLYLLRAGELLFVSSADRGMHWKVAAAFSPQLLALEPELKTITSIAAGSNARLWLGCGHAICEFDPVHHSILQFGEQRGVRPDGWTSLVLTKAGELWARGSKSMVFLPRGARQFNPIVRLPESFAKDVRWPLMLEDPRGRMVLNLSTGIAIGGKDGWHILNAQNGLPEDEIEALLFDSSGALWMTSAGHGVLRWHGYGNWEGWTRKDGLSSNIVWSIALDQAGRHWITTDKGLNKLAAGASRVVSVPSLDGRLFPIVVDQRNHVWTSDRTGTLFDYDPATGHTRVAASNLDRVFTLHIDQQQRIWVCSRNGLLWFAPSDDWKKPRLVTQAELADTYAWSMAEGPGGVLWLATGKGLFRLDSDRWTAISQSWLPTRTHSNFMLAAAHDGTLWMQSTQPFPMVHVRIDGSQATVIERVSSSVITSDNTTFVESDQRGWIWVGSDAGVNVFNGQRWINCAAEDGLLWDDTDFHAFFADPDGSVWIGTSAGVSHLLHPELLFSVATPRVKIVDPLVTGQRLLKDVHPSFDLRKPTLSFHFVNTNYSRGSAIHEKYRLDGEDNDWQETEGRLGRYPSLAAGKYRLQVFAYDDRQHSSSSIETYSFKVLEPWWKRPWFETMEGLGCILVLLALWRLSIHLLVARQMELERLVALRTAELEEEKLQLLNARSSLLEVMRKDPLTGLLNRGAIFESLSQLCESSRNNGIPVAVVMADLDSFKRINDNHGHLVGDAVLRECAARMKRATRPIDAVGRYGGEELLILMPGLLPGALKVRMEQLRLSISGEPVFYDRLALNISCSFGVAWFTGDSCTIESLISMADSALYMAKQNGRNRVEYDVLLPA